MQTATRIIGCRDELNVEGRSLTFLWKSPYRFRVFEGEREVTKEFKAGDVRGIATEAECKRAYALCEQHSVRQQLQGF